MLRLRVCLTQVAVRVRPPSEEEEKRGLAPVVSVDTERRQTKVKYGGQGGKQKIEKIFTFDKVGSSRSLAAQPHDFPGGLCTVQVFGRFSQQDEIFKTTVSHIVDDVLQGLMATVFMYGPTGTGKASTGVRCLLLGCP
jgi:hypothetical protein